ncbi:MAG TPA: hypothetical protein GXX38_10275 [Clostridia bacterium]|jgi:protein arginine kinase activator|nr:hypothetical protein [Clostridia bacterium]
MLCEQCKIRPATVHFTQIINNQKTQMNLCEQCAAEKGGFNFSFGPTAGMNNFFGGFINPWMNNFFNGFINPGMSNFLSGFLNPNTNNLGFMAPAEQADYANLECQVCGLSYKQFLEDGRFGCARCYEAFRDRLNPLFRRIHGSTQHTGKIPYSTGSSIRLKREISQLREELARCVEREDFERAAELRDLIRRLEKQVES